MILVKFTNSIHVEQFRSGDLFMHSLKWFWEHGTGQQKDLLEGTIATQTPEDALLPNEIAEAARHDVFYLAAGYQYCNILCLTYVKPLIGSSPSMVGYGFPSQMDDYGDAAIMITDVPEFCRRVIASAQASGYKVLCRRVDYHQQLLRGRPKQNSTRMTWRAREAIPFHFSKNYTKYDSFDKLDKYDGELEWRICLYRGVKDENEAFTFSIGDLHDITETYKKEDLFSEEAIIAHKELIGNPHEIIEEHGNVGREELRELFYDLGDRTAYLVLGT